MIEIVQSQSILEPVCRYLESTPLPKGAVVSYPIPTVYDGILTDLFFIYRRTSDNIIVIDKVLIVNPYKSSIVATFSTDYNREIKDDSFALDLAKYMELKERYYQLYEIIRPYTFDDKVSNEVKCSIKEYLNVVKNIFDLTLRKVYLDLGGVFFYWAQSTVGLYKKI